MHLWNQSQPVCFISIQTRTLSHLEPCFTRCASLHPRLPPLPPNPCPPRAISPLTVNRRSAPPLDPAPTNQEVGIAFPLLHVWSRGQGVAESRILNFHWWRVCWIPCVYLPRLIALFTSDNSPNTPVFHIDMVCSLLQWLPGDSSRILDYWSASRALLFSHRVIVSLLFHWAFLDLDLDLIDSGSMTVADSRALQGCWYSCLWSISFQRRNIW